MNTQTSEFVKGFVSEYIEEISLTVLNSPRDINRGECIDFAIELADRIPQGATVLELCSSGPGHAWVEIDGVHYDAEAPEGVTDWTKLPYFGRHDTVDWEAEGPPVEFPA